MNFIVPIDDLARELWSYVEQLPDFIAVLDINVFHIKAARFAKTTKSAYIAVSINKLVGYQLFNFHGV